MGERHRRHEGGGQVRSLELRGEVRRTVGVLSAQRHKAGGTPKAESVGREEGEVQVQDRAREPSPSREYKEEPGRVRRPGTPSVMGCELALP